MSVIDEVLRANEAYVAEFGLAHLAAPPARKLAVVACMDARLDLFRMLGLGTGDAHIIRNAGGVVTDDVLRSLIVSHHLLGTREIMIVNHTDCGMLSVREQELRARLIRDSGASPAVPASFHAFSDLEQNVRDQIRNVSSHPWIPDSIPVRGFVYDVRTGRLRELAPSPA